MDSPYPINSLASRRQKWDQFKVNNELFGVTSTYDEAQTTAGVSGIAHNWDAIVCLTFRSLKPTHLFFSAPSAE